MRSTVLAIGAALLLGTATMTTGALAEHGGGRGGGHGGRGMGAPAASGGGFGSHTVGGHATGRGFAGRGMAGHVPMGGPGSAGRGWNGGNSEEGHGWRNGGRFTRHVDGGLYLYDGGYPYGYDYNDGYCGWPTASFGFDTCSDYGYGGSDY